MKRNVGAEKHSRGVGAGQHSPEQREQHHLVDAATRCGRRWLPGQVFPLGLILAVKSAADTWAAGIEESARGRSEGRAGAILSWLTKSVAEEKWATLAAPRKEVIWERGDLMSSRRPASARKVMTQEISSQMFTLIYFISSASHATSFLEEFGFLIIPTVIFKKKKNCDFLTFRLVVVEFFLHIHLYLFLFKFFSQLDCYRILGIIPCATQYTGSCWLFMLNIAVCTCQSQTPYLSP